MRKKGFSVLISIIVALGGFLLGFDSALISGVVPFIRGYFGLNEIQLGWSVSCVLFGAVAGNLMAGPLSDRFGRKSILLITALMFTISAVTSALATVFWFFVVARFLGGIGIGIAILVAPVYIAEIAPANMRGRLVSFNQLMIVIGISASFFSNYFLLQIENSPWRWMLGVETIPAVMFFFLLFIVPESPRWLTARSREDEAMDVLVKANGPEEASMAMQEIRESFKRTEKATLGELFSRKMKIVLVIGIGIAILQQITGINAVLYYAPVIFEQSGLGRDAAFIQAIMVGLTNLVFTLVAMRLIDRLGRKPLLLIGAGGITLSHLLLALAFFSASYRIDENRIANLEQDGLPLPVIEKLETLTGTEYNSRQELIVALDGTLGKTDLVKYKLDLLKRLIGLNTLVVLIGVMGFVASFAVSMGPVMWVLLSEIFPNRLRGLAVSTAGFCNGMISFGIALVFPWELANIGATATFAIYVGFGVLTFLFAAMFIPETKGVSLEQLEKKLIVE